MYYYFRKLAVKTKSAILAGWDKLSLVFSCTWYPPRMYTKNDTTAFLLHGYNFIHEFSPWFSQIVVPSISIAETHHIISQYLPKDSYSYIAGLTIYLERNVCCVNVPGTPSTEIGKYNMHCPWRRACENWERPTCWNFDKYSWHLLTVL